MHRRRAFTLIEILVVVAVIAGLIGLLLPSLSMARRRVETLDEAASLRQLHQSMLVFAGDNNGVLPTPGLINRLPDKFLGVDVPGTGPEDPTQNTSANLYSAMLALQFFPESLLISPAETNPLIPLVKRRVYRFDSSKYQPALDVYWDDTFSADLANGDVNGECHTSYVHLALAGGRKRLRWRSDAPATFVLLGSRGPYRGADPGGPEYDRSYTLAMHGSSRSWAGNVIYGDGHGELAKTFYPSSVTYRAGADAREEKDNIFAAEFAGAEAGGDVFLTMTEVSTENSIEDYAEVLR